jgi:peptidyl-prolyl cis-trans isomerase A (cyclophilin A)
MRYWAVAILVILAACAAPPPAAKKAEAPKPAEMPPQVYRVLFETTKGNFTIEVTRAWAPRGADHFFELVQAKFYDGVRFHRVIRGFVAQFGINGSPRKNAIWSTAGIQDDPVKEKNRKGTLTFAKLGPNSRTTQVFINLRDNLDLDKSGFPPFAKVVEGMDVVEKLYYSYGELAPRGSGPEPGRIETQGEAYLEARFPRLDQIVKATVVR